jgi:hypothetical protein
MEATDDRDMGWFAEADLSAYEGEYVALAHHQVAAHGREPGEVYEEGKKRFPGEKVILWKVMREGSYIFGGDFSHGDWHYNARKTRAYGTRSFRAERSEVEESLLSGGRREMPRQARHDLSSMVAP